jgi:PHB/PHA accumulation regulator DNA-binding domain
MLEMHHRSDAVLIKRYGGWRLYRPATSTYVSLTDLAEMIFAGERFKVLDAETGEDVTFVDTCFSTHHPQYDANDTLWLSGTGPVAG